MKLRRLSILHALVAWPLAAAQPELVLEGVIVASTPSHSIALVRRPEATRARPVHVGETVYDATLVEVGENWVVLEKNGVRSRLELTRPSVRQPIVARPRGIEIRTDPTPSGATASVPEPPVLERDVIEARLQKEMPVILSETRIIPRVVEGEVRGYQITKLPQTSILAELGLEPGDVVLSINGQVVDGLPTLISLYPSALNGSDLVVAVERAGESRILAYRLR